MTHSQLLQCLIEQLMVGDKFKAASPVCTASDGKYSALILQRKSQGAFYLFYSLPGWDSPAEARIVANGLIKRARQFVKAYQLAIKHCPSDDEQPSPEGLPLHDNAMAKLELENAEHSEQISRLSEELSRVQQIRNELQSSNIQLQDELEQLKKRELKPADLFKLIEDAVRQVDRPLHFRMDYDDASVRDRLFLHHLQLNPGKSTRAATAYALKRMDYYRRYLAAAKIDPEWVKNSEKYIEDSDAV